jgi:hypothetical protein
MLTKIKIEYQANYNGCSVLCYFNGEEDGFDDFDVQRKDPDLHVKVEALQDAVIDKAYEDVIKEGRHQGEFNGDTDDLKEFAVNRAKEVFGEGVEIVFEVDDSST